MRRIWVLAVVLAGVSLAVSASAVEIQTAGPKPQTLQTATLQPLSATVFKGLVNKQSWSATRKQEILTAFNKLPAGMQHAVTASLDPGTATSMQLQPRLRSVADIARGPVVNLRLPRITDMWPASGDGCPNAYLLVYGLGLNSNCQIWFNGSARTTYYMPWGADWGECVGCQIPSVPIAANYDLYLKDTAASKSGNHINYRVVAPRSWRGNHGWKFANFGEPTIPWDCFRHYFGANEVEDGAGHHLPAAQAWYDGTYKGVGGGGNCFGMTLRAERTFFWEPWGVFDAWWNSNRLPRAWDYNFINETHRSVNEDQGGQLEASIMANKLWLRDNQTNNQAWERARSLIPQMASVDNPMLSIYGPGWGHCVWPYGTEEVGNTRRIIIYDNNVPYAENEASNTTTVVEINKTTDVVTWGTANRILCRSYHDCTPADPHLPTEATDGDAALMTTIVVDKGATVTQITDEAGRTFYAGGQLNENASTRIPHSMLFVPDTGTKPDPNFPLVFLFGQSANKSLHVTAGGVAGRILRLFNKGLVFEVQPSGNLADLTFDKILGGQTGVLLNQDGPCRLSTIMRVGPRQERVININILSGGRGALIGPNLDRSGVSVENRTGTQLQYDIEIRSFQGGSTKTLRPPTQTLGAQSGALIVPSSWSLLQDANLTMRNLRSGASLGGQILRQRP